MLRLLRETTRVKRVIKRFLSLPMNQFSSADSIAATLAPCQSEIAQCARELWTESGQPDGRDVEIWLEAERRLISARRVPGMIAAASPTPTGQRTSTHTTKNGSVVSPAARLLF
jgi:hypothetical protein